MNLYSNPVCNRFKGKCYHFWHNKQPTEKDRLHHRYIVGVRPFSAL